MMHPVDLLAARAEALFTSDLPAGSRPSRDEVEAAIKQAVRRHRGIKGCLAKLATDYGDHPDTAPARMRWARSTVEALFAEQVGQHV
jgi:hypothetical protein